jgi:serine/threonine protein kinase
MPTFLVEAIDVVSLVPFNVPTPTRTSQLEAQNKTLQTAVKKDGLSADNYTFLKVLGRGSFGKVFLAERKSDKKVFAVKVLKKTRVIEDDDVEATIVCRPVLVFCRCKTGVVSTCISVPPFHLTSLAFLFSLPPFRTCFAFFFSRLKSASWRLARLRRL